MQAKVEMLASYPTFGNRVIELLQAQPWLNLQRSKKPNLPILHTSARNLCGTKNVLFDFIIKRTLASLSAPGSRQKNTVVMKVDNQDFTVKHFLLPDYGDCTAGAFEGTSR